ncbi:cysteine-rich secretory protein, putative [Plasmodium sp. DRC-Itaito]|nr:cysteine-rich secretory protein, putative [Plasmodium sp. DRC-Itaito]
MIGIMNIFLLFFVFISSYIYVNGQFCKFNKDFIRERHNDFRLKHKAKPLRWSKKLEEIATYEANLIRDHSDCIVSSKQVDTNYFSFFKNENIEASVDTWYEGINDYDFELGCIKRNDNIFEFTRIIWKSSQNLGCATACCKTRGILICKYDHNTNRPGYFGDNVGTIDTMYVWDDLNNGMLIKKNENLDNITQL